ncbi:MAG TPA: DUF1800 domain-containing protein [Terriglobales bacterium]|jgi:uncharacterized protein (DUF1800 family)|nr:DUF1800 domain-containing protein [Terriglobales bacterium]
MPSPVRRRRFLAAAVLLAAAAITAQTALGRKKDKPDTPSPLDDQRRAVHALNRLTFGPRPGDVEQVRQMGVDKWIDLQLHPEKINDSSLDAKLAAFPTLRMGTNQIIETFPPEQLIRQIADGKAALPRDAMQRVVYEAQLQRLDDKKERKQEAKGGGDEARNASVTKTSCVDTTCSSMNADAAPTADTVETRRREARRRDNLKTQELADLAPDDRMKEILAMSPEDQIVLAAARGAKADALLEGLNPRQKETVEALNNPEQVVVNELTQAKLLRAIYSERQLDEVMTDFWINHFNVFINKGQDRYLLTSYERDAIRPHVLGKFEDLLLATAKSPAMMFYLDNWLSVGPDSENALGIAPNAHGHNHPQGRPNKRKAVGLNENYGRELMELHTLSVNGGYTQKDVTEVAKVFTGWTIDPPQKGSGFRFDPRMHEPGTKIVLGHRIKEKGEKEGLEVLHLLARNPNTAHFISQKLAIRFVSDNPPPALVDRMAKTYLKKNGDIREVLRTMFKSPEFWAPEAYRAKVKTPLEFVVSAVRASGANVDDVRALVGTLNNMGMMPYAMLPPTGYSMKAETWVNSSALLGRMNFALGLAAGKIRGVKVDPAGLVGGTSSAATSASAMAGASTDASTKIVDARQALAALENSLLAGDVSTQTHDTISKQLEDPKISQRRLDDPKRPPNVAAIAGLILGSPEFQRR